MSENGLYRTHILLFLLRAFAIVLPIVCEIVSQVVYIYFCSSEMLLYIIQLIRALQWFKNLHTVIQ